MIDTIRRYRVGYIDPLTGAWESGVIETQATTGYYDIGADAWSPGYPDVESGEWLPEQAVLVAEHEGCPVDHPIKGNLPSRIFHLPEHSTYERTDPEICFATESAAMMAGFRKSQAANSAADSNSF